MALSLVDQPSGFDRYTAWTLRLVGMDLASFGMPIWVKSMVSGIPPVSSEVFIFVVLFLPLQYFTGLLGGTKTR